MYLLAFNNKDPDKWEIDEEDTYFFDVLEIAQIELEYQRKRFPGTRFEIFECNILQALGPEVFKEE